jgi:hypothetical protein
MKTRSESVPARRAEPRDDVRRRELRKQVDEHLSAREMVLAMLPFASVPKRAKGPEGKVRTGVRQSWRRYRPLVLTDRRLLIFDTGRTPHPRELLAQFARAEVHWVDARPGRFGQTVVVLDLPGLGPVPFETGRLERDDVATLERILRSGH